MKRKEFLTVITVLVIATSAIAFSSQTQFNWRNWSFSFNGKSKNTRSEIPNYILYDKLFRMVFSLKNKAESPDTSSEKIVALTNYFRNRANLSEEENRILQDIAVAFMEQAAPIDAQARAIIEDTRRNAANGTISRDGPPPEELIRLQEQRNELVLSYRERLNASFGADRFAEFDEFVMGEFASRFQRVPLSSVDFNEEQAKEAKQ